ncbi:MAG: DUF454 family protein [Clostridiales bacterium]|nr:DUF454 family protein [Clostridiales bacterium]
MKRYYKDSGPDEKASKTIFGKVIWIIAAVFLILVGIVGLMIPVVPQVPFFFAAALCFCRASTTFGNWFRHLKLYKLLVGEIHWRDLKIFAKR